MRVSRLSGAPQRSRSLPPTPLGSNSGSNVDGKAPEDVKYQPHWKQVLKSGTITRKGTEQAS